MLHRIIATGSKGNAVIYFNHILVDCGVPFTHITPYLKRVQLVLLTHIHSDHFHLSCIKRLSEERPSIRFGIGAHLEESMRGIKNVDILEVGKLYDYGLYKISPVALYHDVSNYGYRLFCGDKKIFHATDTAHLNGIEAKGYDLYAIEHNYNEDTIYDIIAEKESKGEFTHLKGSINTHLSEQQARDFIYQNRKETSEVIRLHESKTAL